MTNYAEPGAARAHDPALAKDGDGLGPRVEVLHRRPRGFPDERPPKADRESKKRFVDGVLLRGQRDDGTRTRLPRRTGSGGEAPLVGGPQRRRDGGRAL